MDRWLFAIDERDNIGAWNGINVLCLVSPPGGLLTFLGELRTGSRTSK